MASHDFNLYIATTSMDVQHVRFMWKIENFLHRMEMPGQCLKSPVFPPDENQCRWRLEIYPNGVYQSTNDSIGLYLRLKKNVSKKTKKSVCCELNIVDVDGTILYGRTCTESPVSQRKKKQSWGFSHFVDLSSLTMRAMLQDDSLIITCCLKIFSDAETMLEERKC